MNHTDLEENISKELEEQILFDAIEEEVNKELINNETLNDEKVDDNIEEVKPKKEKEKR